MIHIEIDCPPFTPRPDVYMSHICEHILHCEMPKPKNPFFGNWTFELDREYKKGEKDKIREYLTECYNRGQIRYAEW